MLEGRLSFLAGTKWSSAGPGETVFVTASARSRAIATTIPAPECSSATTSVSPSRAETSTHSSSRPTTSRPLPPMRAARQQVLAKIPRSGFGQERPTCRHDRVSRTPGPRPLFFEPFERDVPGLSGARLRLDLERRGGRLPQASRLAREGRARNGAGHVPAGEPSLPSSSSGTSSSISGKSCRSSSRMCASSSSPAASNVSRSTMPAATAMSSLRANPSSCTCWTRASRRGAGCDRTYLRKRGKSSSSSSRRWTRSSFLKNSTNSLAAASRAEASPSAAARRSRTACTSPS
jgi:hypothetical protein